MNRLRLRLFLSKIKAKFSGNKGTVLTFIRLPRMSNGIHTLNGKEGFFSYVEAT
jgi:hypothetical protein